MKTNEMNHILTKEVPFESESLEGVISFIWRCLNCNEVGVISSLASEKDLKSHRIYFEKQHKRCGEIYNEKLAMEVKAK